MNLELLLLQIAYAAGGSISHSDLTNTILSVALGEGENMMICEAWDLIEDGKIAGYLRDEWRNSFAGGTLWHLTEEGLKRLIEFEVAVAI